MVNDGCHIRGYQRQDAGLPSAAPDDKLSVTRRLRRRLEPPRVVPIAVQLLRGHRQGLQGGEECLPWLPRRSIEHAAE